MANFARFSGLRANNARVGATVAPVHTRQLALRRGDLQIRCARVAGVEIPNQKRTEVALTYIFGIGPTTASSILDETGIDNKRVKDLSEEELTTLRNEVESYMVEGDLRRKVAMDIKRLKDIGCYRGRRHIAGLPMRGQNTKNNARTRKGKSVPIAGKKK